METRKQIEVTKATREMLLKAFKCSRMSLWRALNFADNSPKSKRIRVAALKDGGITMVLSPECETIHDADGYMRQWFGNGAMLELCKSSGQTEVYDRHGLKRMQQTCATIPDLCAIQRYAEAL